MLAHDRDAIDAISDLHFPSLAVASETGGRPSVQQQRVQPLSRCQCPPNLLMQANKNAISHSAHCPEFRCSLCRSSFSSNFVLSHAESGKHRDKFRAFRDNLFLLSLPDPADPVRDSVLSQTLAETADREALDPDSLTTIRDTIQRLNRMIGQEVSGRASVRPFGSVLTGTAIRRRSDVNLDLVIRREHAASSGSSHDHEQAPVAAGAEGSEEEDGGGENPVQILDRIADLLQRNPSLFPSVVRDFSVSCPRVRFTVTDPATGKPFTKVRCFEILLSGQRTYETSQLLHKYVRMDDRVRVLAVCLRIWSSVCLLDDQESGTWPPHAFTLMLIAFLQRTKPHPVLPFLQPAAASAAAVAAARSSQQTAAAGVAEEQLPETNVHEVVSRDDEGDDDGAEGGEEGDMEHEAADWESENGDSLGKLWLSFLKFYAVSFRAGVHIVSVRQDPPAGPVRHRDKGWGTKILAIEEPFRPWLNLSRSVGSREIFANFLHMIRMTFVYFVTPQLQEGPAFKASNFETTFKQPSPAGGTELDESLDEDAVAAAAGQQENEEEQEEEDGDGEEGGEDGKDGGGTATTAAADGEQEWQEDSSRPFRVAALISRRHGICLQMSADVQSSLQKLDFRKLRFRFNFAGLDWFRNVKKFCHSCRKSGHSSSACPAESLPRVVDLPPVFPAEVLSFHSHIYESMYQEERITETQDEEHRFVTADLLSLIREQLLPDADMQLFGSCVNGFGSSSSDMDLCLTLRSDPTGKSLDANRLEKMIHDLAAVLHGHAPILKSSILPIVHAKVPIVKFTYVLNSSPAGRRREIQCDVSLYNVLGCSNTRLLRAYCDIDPRVPVLGFVVKHLAKTCDIADASRGSLSSYAYTLLTIHFLQGVVPVLQELGWDRGPDSRKRPERLVDGCNTWFCEDMDLVRRIWQPDPSSAGLCVADLFIRFLRFYSEEFSFADYVVCCRRSAALTRLEKMWTGKRIAIEDPFLLTHNLGAGLAPQMATFVQSCLILARNHFGQALAYVKPPSLPHSSIRQDEVDSEVAFLFNRKMLTNGTLPTGRGCRLCGRISHKVKDCPMRRDTARGHNRMHGTGGRNQQEPPASAFACFACGSPRHKVSACPEVAAGAGMQQQRVHRMPHQQPHQHGLVPHGNVHWNNGHQLQQRPAMAPGFRMQHPHQHQQQFRHRTAPAAVPRPHFVSSSPSHVATATAMAMPSFANSFRYSSPPLLPLVQRNQQQPFSHPRPPGRTPPTPASSSFRRISVQQLLQQQQPQPQSPVTTNSDKKKRPPVPAAAAANGGSGGGGSPQQQRPEQAQQVGGGGLKKATQKSHKAIPGGKKR